jgi:nitrogen fixation-related uncharacterized protein
MKTVAKIQQEKGAALAITLMMVTIVAVIVQTMFFLATTRARISGQLEDLYAADHIALNGLECGLAQAVFQQALAGGGAGECLGQSISLTPSSFDDFDIEFILYGDRATCGEVFVRQNKTDDYTVRSVGYLVCGNDGPVDNGFDQQRVVRVMNITQTDEGQVSRSLVSN